MEYYDLEGERCSGWDVLAWCKANLKILENSKYAILEFPHLNKSGKPVKTFIGRTSLRGGRFLLTYTVKVKS